MIKLAACAFVASLALAPAAHAGDSSWLLCKGVGDFGAKDVSKTHLVASVHEHRGADGSSRDLSVTLIYGVHLSRGDVLGKSAGKDGDVTGKEVKLDLASLPKGKRVFTGTALLSEDMKTFTLKGSIDPTYGDAAKPAMEPVTAKLACELLDDLAIGK